MTFDDKGRAVADESAEVCFPVYEAQSDPDETDAELWINGDLIHRIRMRRMTADFNGRIVYAPVSSMTRSSPGSSFEHTVNMAVNNTVTSGRGPTDPSWKAQ